MLSLLSTDHDIVSALIRSVAGKNRIFYILMTSLICFDKNESQ